MKLQTLFALLISLALPALVSAAEPAAAAGGGRIKKCQDASGRWHYGDTAAEECARSKVIELSGQGVKRKEIAAPPTEEELKQQEAQREELARQKQQTEEQRRRDEVLLSSYGHEDDIIYARDRKLAVLEANIKAGEETVKQLRAALERLQAEKPASGKGAEEAEKNITRTREQIARHEAAIAAKRQEYEQIRKQYQADLQRFRELKSQPPPKGAGGP